MRLSLAVLFALSLACMGGPAPEASPAPDTRPVAAPRARAAGSRVGVGALTEPLAFSDHAILLPAGADPAAARAVAERIVAARGLSLVTEVPTAPTAPFVLVATPTLAEAGFDPATLEYFGVDLADADLAGIAAARDELFLSVGGPAAAGLELQHQGVSLTAEVAAETGGWVSDLWTAETFTRDGFRAHHPDGFPAEVGALTVVHMVREESDGVLLESRGLARFGLPELILRGVPATYAAQLQVLLEAAGQVLLERATVTADGELTVDLAALTTPPWPEYAATAKADGGTGRVTFRAVWSAGDHEGGEGPLLIELELPGEGEVAARAYEALRVFGDPEAGARQAKDDDPELLAARDRARVALAALAPHFAGGVPELERLLVKAPFPTHAGGIEWMWVEVASWKGDTLRGVLLNDPFDPSDVKAGDTVEVRVGETFDYVHQHADGTQAGGETNTILEKREPR